MSTLTANLQAFILNNNKRKTMFLIADNTKQYDSTRQTVIFVSSTSASVCQSSAKQTSWTDSRKAENH